MIQNFRSFCRPFIALFFLFFSLSNIGFGQCPNVTSLNITTQAQLDAFATDYPNCTDFPTTLRILGEDITSLNGLAQLNSVHFFVLDGLSSLTSLNGLENLTSIGEFFCITANNALTNLNGLENLSGVDEIWFDIERNDNLVSLDGISGFNYIRRIDISNNPSLIDLSGLSNLQSVDYLAIETNELLSNLSGLDNLEVVIDNFVIQNNDNLINLTGLESLIELPGDLRILSNDILP